MSDTSRRIVVTGVSRGLGRAMTAELIERGHTVVACARSEAGLTELRKRWPAPHRFDQVDVAEDEQVGRWAQDVLAGGPVDLLLNNAALINRIAPLWEVPAEEFSRLFDVNVKGVANVIRHFVPAMIQRASGVIVNFSSGRGRTAGAGVAPYSASKFAIEGLTQALAQELPAGLTAVALNPGAIDTDMLRISFGARAADYPEPAEWARRAVPYILQIGRQDNGQPLSVPA